MSLGDAQAILLHILAGEDVGIREHVAVYQLADNLVWEWPSIAADDSEAVVCRPIGIVIWILWGSDVVGLHVGDVDARVRTATYDDALLVLLRQVDVGRQLITDLLEELLERLVVFEEDEFVAISLCLEQVVVLDGLLVVNCSFLLGIGYHFLEILVLPVSVGWLVLANLLKPLIRGERQEIVAQGDGHVHLYGVCHLLVETLRRVRHLLQGELETLLVAQVEVAAVVKPCQDISARNLYHIFLHRGIVFAQELAHALILRCRLILLVEDVIYNLCRHFQGAEEEWHSLLHVSTLLVVMPEEELDVGEVDLVFYVWSIVARERTVDVLHLVLVERNVATVALHALRSKCLPNACARERVLEISSDGKGELLGILYVLEVMCETSLVQGVVYSVCQFGIVLIYFVRFFVWMHCHPFLSENYFFHIVRLLLLSVVVGI